MTNKSSKKGGRPSKLDTIDRAQVEKLARAGWTDDQISDFFGITKQTLNNWKKKEPEFFDSLKDWKAEADHAVERSLYERACGYRTVEERIVGKGENAKVLQAEKEHPPDTTACIFWLKNRNPGQWRDKVDHGHEGDLNVFTKVVREIVESENTDS